MKKTLVALAVAAVAATSANAAVVYDNNGSKLEVKGSLRVLLSKEGKNQRGDLKNDGSRVIFDAQQQLGNGLSAFGQADLRFDNTGDIEDKVEKKKAKAENTFTAPNLDSLYVGLAQEGVGALSFGKQSTNADDAKLGAYVVKWAAGNNVTDSADKSVKFRSADFNGFSFGLDYLFGNADKHSEADANKNGYGAAVFYTMPFGGDMNMNLAAAYGQDKMNSGKTKVNWRTAAELEFGPGAFAVNYGESKTKGKNDKTKFLTVDAKYAVTDMSTLAAQYNRSKAKGASASNGYLVSAEYKLHKNVKTFVEFGRNTTAHENKYGAGLRVFF